MKTIVLYLIGIVTILFSLYHVAKNYENGDVNATSMYLLVYSIPLIVISLINCSLLKLAEKYIHQKFILIILSTFFPVISIILILTNDMGLNLFGTIGIIAFGVTNLIWFINFKKNLLKENINNF